jgi:hypothetical protein
MKFVDKINKIFFLTFSKNRSVYEVILKNVVQPVSLKMKIWRRIECWVNKATSAQAHTSTPARTHSPTRACTNTQTHKCVRHIAFFQGNMCFPKRSSVTSYVHFLSCSVYLRFSPSAVIPPVLHNDLSIFRQLDTVLVNSHVSTGRNNNKTQ